MPLFLEAELPSSHARAVSSRPCSGAALCADLVLANTVVEARAVRALSGARVPVLWWLRSPLQATPTRPPDPRELGENIRLYSVGSHAANAMHSVRPEFNIRPLIYGLPDYAAEVLPLRSELCGRAALCSPPWVPSRTGKARTSSARPSGCCRLETMKKASFLFVGKAAEADDGRRAEPDR